MKMRKANHGRLETTVRVLNASVLAMVLVGTAACSKSSSGGGAASSAAGSAAPGSSLAAAGGQATGPLLRKAAEFHQFVQRNCIQDGLLFDVVRDATGSVVGVSGGDSCIWTGLYVAAEAERYRVTGDPDALANMERSLRGLHILQDITDVPGYLTRFYGRPPLITNQEPGIGQYQALQWHKNQTISRDQYTGWMLGVGLAWPHIQDQVLRDQIQQDCRLIAAHLMTNRLKIVVPKNGVDEVHFNLNPEASIDRSAITPQSWATLDDFPLNLMVAAIPYDDDIADAIAAATFPPIKAGEALRALMFFRVMATVTGDPAIEDYYRNELLGTRDFLSVLRDYGTIQDDIFSGRNLHVVVDMMRSMGGIVTDVLAAWVRSRTGRLGPFAGRLAARLMRPVIDWIARQVGQIISSAIQWLSNPSNMSSAGAWAGRLQTLGTVMSALGLNSLGQRFQTMAGQAGAYMQSDLETARRTIQSGVGRNLTYSALYGLLELETDPNVRAGYQDLLTRRQYYDGWNLNSYFNLIHDAYATTGPVPGLNAQTVDSLQRHYSVADNQERRVDNSGLPGVVVSPWPDRFGRVGNRAVDPFPLDRRPPHQWTWQEHPCNIISGSNGSEEKTGGGYLLAYWLGRRSGLIQPGW